MPYILVIPEVATQLDYVIIEGLFQLKYSIQVYPICSHPQMTRKGL